MPSSTSSRASSTDAPALTGKALVVRALTGPLGAPVVHDVALDVARGEMLVIVGPIQSGKSTLVRHLLGLEVAVSGTVRVGDAAVDMAMPRPAALRALRQRIGVIFESSALLQHITVVDNVELPLLEHGVAGAREARQVARELLWEAGVHADEAAVPSQLGRAAQRRVALARALALKPDLLLLDEPTVGLDAHAAHEFDETINGLQARHGFGVLILSREVRHAFAPSRRVAVMAGGRIVACGDLPSLMESTEGVVRRLLHRRGGA